MTDLAKKLCDELVACDSDSQVANVLKESGYWDSPGVWRPLGDNHNNHSIVGNQQEDAVSALAEKITNSVDAILINKCLESGIDPRGSNAPQSITEAVAKFFENKTPPLNHGEGISRNWSETKSASEIKTIAQSIWLSATGTARPSITIADRGEGQTPDSFPSTFMSLVAVKQVSGYTQSQKRDIPFVQGQYGMGGSGVYAFCSDPNNFQLLISRRNPKLLGTDPSPSDLAWGFTIVRRNRGLVDRSSVYEYLAPIGIEQGADEGEWGQVLRFAASTYPILPEHNPKTMPVNAYDEEVEYGTLIKLYEYQYKADGISQSHLLRKDSLLRQLDLVLPDAILPVRVLEARSTYNGTPGSMSNNLRGILSRMEGLAARHGFDDIDEASDDQDSDAPENSTVGVGLEGPAVYGSLTVRGVDVPVVSYVFTEDPKDLNRKGKSAIIFSVNGQKHAVLGKGFISSKKINLPWISRNNLFLSVVDCSNFVPNQREDLFMASRDRMKQGTQVTNELLSELTDFYKSSDELRKMQTSNHKRSTESRLNDRAPVRNILKNLLKASPNLARFFKFGARISSPFPGPGSTGGSQADFVGQMQPTFFRLKNGEQEKTQVANLGNKSRILFETDVQNDYFNRSRYTGRFYAKYVNSGELLTGGRGQLQDGQMSYSLTLPESAKANEKLVVEFSVADDVNPIPFVCTVTLDVQPERSNEGGGTGGSKQRNSGEGDGGGTQSVDDLVIHKYVRENPIENETLIWPPGWNERTALCIDIDPDTEAITFKVNVDNSDLKFVQKETPGTHPKVLEGRYVYSLVLLALSLIQYEKNRPTTENVNLAEDEEKPSIEDTVAKVMEALSPMMIPMIDAIGTMTADMLEDE